MKDEEGRTRLSRRDILALSAAGYSASLAGCSDLWSSSDDDPSETPGESPTRSPTESPSESPGGFDVGYLGESPSSHVAPTDGFADADWLNASSPSVVTVTNLDNDGEGSFRWALSQPEPRIIVFEVGGTIDIQGDPLFIEEPNVYIAGQTAPSPGITVIRGGLKIGVENVILQHLRVRPGDDINDVSDSIGNIDNGANVIVDHCSGSWATDENISTNSDKQKPDITLSNNLAAECLADSIHPSGVHSYGTLVMDDSKRVTIASNLWAHNIGRHPRLKGGSTSVVVNNVAYNFERAVRLGAGVDNETVTSVVGNYYRGGSQSVEGPIIDTNFGDTEGPVTVHESDNEVDQSSVGLRTSDPRCQFVSQKQLWPDTLTAISPTEAYETVLDSAGARPADRTPNDERVINDVEEGTGSVIDSQTEVGGYPDLQSTERPLDVPDDNLAEWLYQHTEAVELSDATAP